jgi:hypothetical protein
VGGLVVISAPLCRPDNIRQLNDTAGLKHLVARQCPRLTVKAD